MERRTRRLILSSESFTRRRLSSRFVLLRQYPVIRSTRLLAASASLIAPRLPVRRFRTSKPPRPVQIHRIFFSDVGIRTSQCSGSVFVRGRVFPTEKQATLLDARLPQKARASFEAPKAGGANPMADRRSSTTACSLPRFRNALVTFALASAPKRDANAPRGMPLIRVISRIVESQVLRHGPPPRCERIARGHQTT